MTLKVKPLSSTSWIQDANGLLKLVFFGTLVLWLLWALLFISGDFELATTSAFGDFFAPLEVLLSGYALAFLAYTAYLQRKQLDSMLHSLELQSCPTLLLNLSDARLKEPYLETFWVFDKNVQESRKSIALNVSMNLSVVNELPAFPDNVYCVLHSGDNQISNRAERLNMSPVIVKGSLEEAELRITISESTADKFFQCVSAGPITLSVGVSFRTALNKEMLLSARYLLTLRDRSNFETVEKYWKEVSKDSHLEDTPIARFGIELLPRTYTIQEIGQEKLLEIFQIISGSTVSGANSTGNGGSAGRTANRDELSRLED